MHRNSAVYDKTAHPSLLGSTQSSTNSTSCCMSMQMPCWINKNMCFNTIVNHWLWYYHTQCIFPFWSSIFRPDIGKFLKFTFQYDLWERNILPQKCILYHWLLYPHIQLLPGSGCKLKQTYITPKLIIYMSFTHGILKYFTPGHELLQPAPGLSKQRD